VPVKVKHFQTVPKEYYLPVFTFFFSAVHVAAGEKPAMIRRMPDQIRGEDLILSYSAVYF
jgi:hypothetical protein